MDRPKKNYEVGYGKPPNERRFKAGVSGNPKGRPKGKKNQATIINEIALTPITITENGKRRTVTIAEAIVCRLANTALTGNLRATREFLYFHRSAEVSQPSEEQSFVPHERDEAVKASFLKRMQKMMKTSADELQTQQINDISKETT